uniref:Uncharacterized protein n=1 Tax=Rhizophora mucronata TaxID=61149 RepID=A0A2P2JUE5_RHIMU
MTSLHCLLKIVFRYRLIVMPIPFLESMSK